MGAEFMENDMTKAEISEILENRCSTYAFLSQMYREEVSSALLSQLVSELATDEAQGDVGGEGHELLRQFALGVRNSDLGQVETELAAEYARLFLIGRKDGVFPYESVYTSEERLLMQEARDEVLLAYRQEGLDKTEAFKEPEDHLALELGFMVYLCQKTVESMERAEEEAAVAYLEKQKDFLQAHLMVWVPQFCQDLAQVTRSDFYRGMAKITQEHLNLEGETIDELLGAFQGLGKEG